MKAYTVHWTEDADNQLAEIWLAHSNRDAVSNAVALIERRLERDAPNEGADLREGLRVIKVALLKAIYLVEDRKVEIARITLAQ